MYGVRPSHEDQEQLKVKNQTNWYEKKGIAITAAA